MIEVTHLCSYSVAKAIELLDIQSCETTKVSEFDKILIFPFVTEPTKINHVSANYIELYFR